MAICWSNGSLIEEQAAAVSVRDSGFLHAAGVFTTMRACGGRVFQLAEHQKRLRDSCQALEVPLPYPDEQLAEAVEGVLRANNLSDARLRLTVTRGVVQEGAFPNPTAILTATRFEPYPEEYYEKGIPVLIERQQRLNPHDMQAGHKTLNYFSRLSVLHEAKKHGAGEVIWLNIYDKPQSGCISNLFIVKDKTLITPLSKGELEKQIVQLMEFPGSNVLPGVTRGMVLKIAAACDIKVETAALTLDDLMEAEECFLTNSLMGIMPVSQIDGQRVGNSIPGDLTRQLGALYRSLVERFATNG